MTKKRPSRLQRTAYHEAGHAVVCYLYHLEFDYVSIVGNEQDFGCLAAVRASHLGPMKAAILCLAGLVAEAVIAGEGRVEATFALRADGPEPENDMELVGRIVAILTNDVEEARKYLNDFLERTVDELTFFPDHWASVNALAAELIKHRRIEYGRAMEIIREAIHSYRSKHGGGLCLSPATES